MTGADYELLHPWTSAGEPDHLERKSPVRLRDREALSALLHRFAVVADGSPFSISINEEDYGLVTDVDALMSRVPPHVTVLHIQTSDAAHLVVRMTAWRGGQTWVDAPEGDVFYSPLRSLVGVVEAHSRRLGARRHLWRLGRARWVKQLVPSVIERTPRDVIIARRVDFRTAVIATIFGTLAGWIAGRLG